MVTFSGPEVPFVLRPVTSAQLRPLYGAGLPANHLPDGAQTVPRGRKKLPLKPPTEPTREDEIFAALRRAAPKARARMARRNDWILTETWRLVDERVSAHRDPEKGQAIKRSLGRAIKASLAADRRRRADEAGAEVEALVGADPPLIQEDCYRIQGWYKAAVDHALPPAQVNLERITAERVPL